MIPECFGNSMSFLIWSGYSNCMFGKVISDDQISLVLLQYSARDKKSVQTNSNGRLVRIATNGAAEHQSQTSHEK